MSLIWRPGFQFDVDASAYIEAVEAADEIASPGIGALETGVRYAINNFVIGCKQDGIWDAIKASCILAGARTLDGALVPLVGAAPTNVGPFVSDDYNRETGLVGDGSSKNLDTKRDNNADPQNSFHLSVYASTVASSGYLIGDIYTTGWNAIARSGANLLFAARTGASPIYAVTSASGFLGASRSASANFASRISGATTTTAQASQTITQNRIRVFANSNGGERGAHRLSFYSIGEALDLAALDGRVTDLMTAIGAAIP
jgi:hypothetical protein